LLLYRKVGIFDFVLTVYIAAKDRLFDYDWVACPLLCRLWLHKTSVLVHKAQIGQQKAISDFAFALHLSPISHHVCSLLYVVRRLALKIELCLLICFAFCRGESLKRIFELLRLIRACVAYYHASVRTS